MLPYPGLEYEELFRRITERSRRIFLTENIVMPLALSQPGAQEVMLRNFVSHKLLCCVNGSVSQQWADIAAALGLETILLESEWGEPVFPNEFRQALEQTPSSYSSGARRTVNRGDQSADRIGADCA